MQRAVMYALLNGCELLRDAGRPGFYITRSLADCRRMIFYPDPSAGGPIKFTSIYEIDGDEFMVLDWAAYNSKLGRLHTDLIDQLLEGG